MSVFKMYNVKMGDSKLNVYQNSNTVGIATEVVVGIIEASGSRS